MSTLDAPDNRRKKGGRQVARPNRPWTQTGLASRHAYNAAGVMLTRADMKELGSTDNNSDDGEYDAKRDAALSYDVAIAEMRRRKEWRDKLTAAKRVEFIGNCMMIQGDCLEVMPQIGKVDACIGDPPYQLSDSGPGISHHFGNSLRKFDSERYKKIVSGIDYQRLFDAIEVVCAPFHSFIFCSNKQISKLMTESEIRGLATTLLVWHKTNSVPFANGVWRGDIEYIIHSRGKGATFLGGANDKTKVLSHPIVIDDAHPTVKPLTIIQRLIKNCSTAKQTILDPFMGSGTTGVACVKTGRHFIGIELDPDYFEIACRRVREAYAQPDLLIDAPKAAPEVQEAFEL